MKINKTLLGMAVLTLIATAGITASYASRGYQADGLNVGPRFDQVNHQAIQDALDNNDYQTWSELMNGRGPADLITEDNFTKFVEMHKLMISGDKEGAQAIRDELGLSQMPNKANKGFGKGMGMGLHRGYRDR